MSARRGLARNLRRRARRPFKPLLPALAGAGALSIVALIVGLAGPARSGTPAVAEIERLIELAGFGLQQVSITGHRFTADGDIFDAIGLRHARTLLTFDSRAAQTRIEALPWVDRASIERVIPDRLEVRITERTPFAVWRLGARTMLIDRSGRVLDAVPASAMPALPRVAGEGAAGEAAKLLALLAVQPALLGRLELAERVGARRWTLRLSGGASIQLPADGEAEALARAAWLVGTQARVNEVDLRVADRTLVREPRDGKDQIERALESLATGGI